MFFVFFNNKIVCNFLVFQLIERVVVASWSHLQITFSWRPHGNMSVLIVLLLLWLLLCRFLLTLPCRVRSGRVRYDHGRHDSKQRFVASGVYRWVCELRQAAGVCARVTVASVAAMLPRPHRPTETVSRPSTPKPKPPIRPPSQADISISAHI
jgi:hypothetical protein